MFKPCQAACSFASLIFLLSQSVSAEEPKTERREPKLAAAAARQRTAHVDYDALKAGVTLLALAYGVALSYAAAKHFDGSPARKALPLIGPWFRQTSWGWAFDGLAQLGGAAFIADAFVSPVTVLGPPIELRASDALSLSLQVKF